MKGQSGLTLPVVLGVVVVIFFSISFLLGIVVPDAFLIDKEVIDAKVFYAAEAGLKIGLRWVKEKMVGSNVQTIDYTEEIHGSINGITYKVDITGDSSQITIVSSSSIGSIGHKIALVLEYNDQIKRYEVKKWQDNRK